ncbi:hypothetical protein ABIB57_004856 [Devosia sp. UYZn731]|uniref:DUF6894 family protein n=1 Tax=Devosia sp. UYZn731 TaxID=3156345 RepID=UPI00339618B6
MALYFFDMIDGHDVPDTEGREIDGGLARVRDEALEDAREMIADAARIGIDVIGRRFEIRDEQRNVVLTVHFAEAIEPEHSVSAERSSTGHSGQ